MWAGDVAVIMDMMDMSGADWSIHRPGETWGRVLRTLSPSWWLDLHTQPPSVHQRLWRHCQGGGTQCKQRRPPLAPPTWTLWCEREIQLFVFLATVLLHLFVTAVFSEYYGMLPSNCPLRSSFPHISLRSASPGSLSNNTTVFIKKDGPNISHPFPTSSDLRKPSVLGPQWGKIQFPQNCQVCPKFFRL